jgi:hypothetical protein
MAKSTSENYVVRDGMCSWFVTVKTIKKDTWKTSKIYQIIKTSLHYIMEVK